MKYPIGIQNFEDIRKDDYVYVDKTALLYNLVDEGTTISFLGLAASVKVFFFLLLKLIFKERKNCLMAWQ